MHLANDCSLGLLLFGEVEGTAFVVAALDGPTIYFGVKEGLLVVATALLDVSGEVT